MFCARAQRIQRLLMGFGAIPFMTGKPISRPDSFQRLHLPVSVLFGHDRGRRDRQAERIPSDNRLAISCSGGWQIGKNMPIHQHRINWPRQRRGQRGNRGIHRPKSGWQQPVSINISGAFTGHCKAMWLGG